MRSNETIGNKQKGIVHMAKQQLKLSEEAYRDMLRNVGVDSAAYLTWWQYDQLMRDFRTHGFQLKPKRKKRSGWKQSPPAKKKKLLSKIGAILTDLGLPDSYADGVARNVAKVDKVVFADLEGLRKIVAALTYHQKRMQ